MSQVQLDLPQISVARYLELLKRRRWQVIPVSVLGLAIGGLVAFFVPRYYVAETQLIYEGDLHDVVYDERRNPDPLQVIVREAYGTIPRTVPAALEDIGWPEYFDPSTKAEFIDRVKSDVVIHDGNRGKDMRTFVQLRVTYRDTSGERAADFLNLLIDKWRTEQVAKLRASAERDLADATRDVVQADQALARARAAVQNHQRTHGLDPLAATGARGVDSPLMAKKKLADARLLELGGEIAELEHQVAAKRQALESGAIPQTIRVRVDPPPEDPAEKAVMSKAIAEVALLEQKLLVLGEARSERAAAEARLRELRPVVTEYLARTRPTETEEKVNPDWQAAQRELAVLQDALDGRRAARDATTGQIEALDGEIEALAGAWGTLQGLQRDVDAATDKLTTAERNRDEVEKKAGIAKRPDRLIRVTQEALPPPRPTEPNIALVAAIGSLVGLGLAIALILALDFVRSTFKTVQDVERALPVPVLGSFDYLETLEQRTRTVTRRRRVSLVAGAFVVLLVSIVTIYYVAPGRLPPFVFDALDFLLGEIPLEEPR